MEYWDQEWNKADPKKTKFKNLQDFISWSLSNTDQP